MFAVGNLIAALASILDLALTIYMWVIIARALLSWVNPDPYNPIVRMLYNVTEPVLGWVRCPGARGLRRSGPRPAGGAAGHRLPATLPGCHPV